jgi:hypothetical protein
VESCEFVHTYIVLVCLSFSYNSIVTEKTFYVDRLYYHIVTDSTYGYVWIIYIDTCMHFHGIGHLVFIRAKNVSNGIIKVKIRHSYPLQFFA